MLVYWIWLTTRQGLGNLAIQKILTYFSSPEEAYFANASEYRLAGLDEKQAQALADKSLDVPREILDQCAQKDIHILTYQDAAYSNRLRNIHGAPAVLYYKGVLPALDDEPLVAVVGSRKSSPYGLTCAKRLGYQIAACGGIVVSGMAYGGDAMAMIGAVSAGRSVIGVLGCGVDVIYPRSNRHLYDDLCLRGCLISEYPPGTEPMRGNFPARNRIISGLSLGVVVVEAPLKSGTLITANLALEQGRDLFAVPGNIGLDCCAGSNQLLKDGAMLVETGWDVMREYEQLYPGKIQRVCAGTELTPSLPELRGNLDRQDGETAETGKNDKKAVDNPEKEHYIDVQDILAELTEEERRIVLALQKQPMHVDNLIAACGGSPGKILASLTLLEIKKYIDRLPGNRYELAKKP